MKKFMLRLIPVVMVALLMLGGFVFAIDPKEPTGGQAIQKVTQTADNLWATVAAVVQILAVLAVVVAGVRYMFASADTKADIKQQTIILVVGAVLVFAAVPLSKFVQTIAKNIFGSN